MSETQRFEKENVQTACDADLFNEDDDMEDTNTESWTTTQFDTPQCTMTIVCSSSERELCRVQ
jgi:hypothetical protein